MKSAIEYGIDMIDAIMNKYEAKELPPEGFFHYHQGVFLSGVYNIYKLTNDEKYIEYIKAWVDSVIDDDGTIHCRDYADLDDIQPGILLFPLYEKYKDKTYLNGIEYLLEESRHVPRLNSGGFYHKVSFKEQMWLDGLYMIGPFLSMASKLKQNDDLKNLVLYQLKLIKRYTFDEKTGLYYHGYDDSRKEEWANKETGRAPEFWARSISWLPIAMLDDDTYLSLNKEEKNALISMLTDLLISVSRYQGKDGRWYQVLDKGDRKDNWEENSATALFAAAYARAVKKGYLDKKYKEVALKAFEGVVNTLTYKDGLLQLGDVCIGTGIGDYYYYINRPVSTNDLHGAGAFLLMCSAIAELER